MTMENKRVLNQLALREAARQGLTLLETFPSIASIGLTLKCNLSCIMCFTRGMAKKDLDMKYLEMLDELFPYMQEVRWNDAGELFASSRANDYLDFINNHPVPVSSLSSSFTLAHKFFDKIFAGGITHLSVSMDGATQETYESIRQGASFKKVMDNLETFRDLKLKRGTSCPQLTFVFVAMKRNIHELPDFVDLVKNLGATSIHVLRLLPGPQHVELTEQVDTALERKYYGLALQKAKKHGIILKHISLENKEFDVPVEHGNIQSNPYASVPVQTFERPFSEFRDTIPFCLAPWQEVVIGVEGEIRPCCFMDREMGSLKNQEFKEIWNGELYQDLRSRLYNGDICYCSNCSWVKKFFAYYKPVPSRYIPPWESFLKRMEHFSRLDSECCTEKYGRFPRENDPIYHTINKLWQIFPEQPNDQIMNQQDQPEESSIQHGNQRMNKFKQWIEKFLVPILEQRMKSYQNEYLVKQQEFNVSIVQYINMLAERFDTIFTRQVHFNQETTRVSNMVNTRMDQLARDIQGLLNVMYEQKYQKKTLEPVEQEAIFYKAKYTLGSTVQRAMQNTNMELTLVLSNESLSTWHGGIGIGNVQVEATWINSKGLPLEDLKLIKPLENNLEPGTGTTVVLYLHTPLETGLYTVSVDLVVTGITSFSKCGVSPLIVPVEVVST